VEQFQQKYPNRSTTARPGPLGEPTNHVVIAVANIDSRIRHLGSHTSLFFLSLSLQVIKK